jgi:selenocysteine lyase/cysteine desulfurase
MLIILSVSGLNIKKIRNDFPLLSEWVYLDNAFVGVIPKQVKEGYEEFIDLWYNFRPPGDKTILQEWLERTRRLRKKIADFIKVTPDEIAFTMCTGSGLNIVVNGMTWKKGDNVVFPAWEHNMLHTNTTVRNGVESRVVQARNKRFELNDIEKQIDNRTKLIQVSHVSYVNGDTVDLKALSDIAHEHDAKVMVDATQAVGALDVDYEKSGVDFVSVAPYKYLMGPTGLAFLYIRKENIDDLIPDRTGWKNQIYEGDNPEESVSEGTAEKFEYGTINFQGIFALEKSIDYLNKIGSKQIEKRNLMLAGYIYDELIAKGKEMYTPDVPKSPIVSYYEDDPLPLAARLKAMKIKVTGREAHGGHVRISGHFYNTREDVEKLIPNLS